VVDQPMRTRWISTGQGMCQWHRDTKAGCRPEGEGCSPPKPERQELRAIIIIIILTPVLNSQGMKKYAMQCKKVHYYYYYSLNLTLSTKFPRVKYSRLSK